MSNVLLLGTSAALLAVGALAALTGARSRRGAGWISVVFVAASAFVAGVVVVDTFVHGPEPEVNVLSLSVLGAQLALVVDPLSAFFLAVVAGLAVLSTLYSVDYMTHYTKDAVAKFYPVLLVFFISMGGVLVVADFLFFLVFWELMTLTSFFLVAFERETPESQRAGLKYFVITHAATLCMVAAGLILWRNTGSFHFAAMREGLISLLAAQPFVGHLVIFLLVIGFATKAGVLPMGDWLPDAHPVAPSGMSAVLSGVLVKLGIYGIIRLFCSLVPVSPFLEAWGIGMALAGTVSLLVGNLTAVAQTDTKRLMAFSTIGQIGYICLGLGAGVYCLPTRQALAALALMGSLFHVANHACFKSCLFLGAGAVLYRTGQRDMNKLGGLGRAMPTTAGSSTVAALSIAGVPPFNGFASKWMILAVSLLVGMKSPVFLLFGLVGLFVSLATLAAFVKVLGAVFLGSPRERNGGVAEVPLAMVAPQVALAALCVLLGLFPRVPLHVIHTALASTWPVPFPPADVFIGGSPWAVVLSVPGASLGFCSPLAIFIALALVAFLAYGLQRAGAASVRNVDIWACGERHASEEIAYPASSFYVPFKTAIEGIYPRFSLPAPRFPSWLRGVFDCDKWFYMPVAHLFGRLSTGVSRTHVGTPQVYLLWIVAGAVLAVGVAFSALL